jgi:hypothetical protein
LNLPPLTLLRTNFAGTSASLKRWFGSFTETGCRYETMAP